MKNYNILAVMVSILLISACGIKEPSQSSLQMLEEEVMAIHDSVMPDMPKIHYQKEALVDWSKSEEFEDLDSTDRQNIASAIRALKKAEDAMWDWMSDYADESEEMKGSDDSLMNVFLLRQKSEIIRVRDMMLSSMSAADSLFNTQNQ